MSVGKRKPAPRDPPPYRAGGLRVVEHPPGSIHPTAHVAGAGQCLFLLFRDELLALRQRQIAATTPAREVSRV